MAIGPSWSVFPAVAGACAALCAGAALSGCANNKGGSNAVANGVEYNVVVSNESRHDVEAAWWVAFMRDGDTDPGKGLERPLGLVRSHETARDSITCMNPVPAPGEPGYVQVVRLKLTMPAPSWQEPARMWWEVVGPLPEKFVIMEGPGPDGFTVKVMANGTNLEAVPRQYWSGEGDESPK
jgi:hypothetical protein